MDKNTETGSVVLDKTDTETEALTADNAKADTQSTVLAPVKKKRRKKKKTAKIIIILVVIATLLGVGLYFLLKLFNNEEEDKTVLTDVVQIGSIQSMVTGSGVTKAKDSATITLATGGTVLEVYVKDGDTVAKGDALYRIDSSDAQAAVDAAQKTVDNYKKQLNAINKSYSYLTVTADYGGILIGSADIEVGDTVGVGTKLATLVDDSKLKLTLYFNYAYQNDIAVGQAVSVSVPSTMSQLEGTITEINYTKRITPEGSQLFQAVVTMDNPGVLTADMGATAVLKSADGELIYPYEYGKLAYNRSTDIITKAGGVVEAVNLLEYGPVSAGEFLLQMEAEDNDEQVATLENQLKTAQDTLTKAQDSLADLNAVSPMDGTVLSCSLQTGQEVKSGTTVISIADTSVMTIEVQVDAMNVSYVKSGMPVTITQWGREGELYFMGTVESVSMEGKFENGYSYYPAVVTVDNLDGGLLSGMGVDYSLVASQSDNCMMVPVQAVKYTESGACLYIRTDEKPDNALDAAALGLDVPEGFYAVPVTVGLSDTASAEIIEGVEVGTEVFTQYMTDNGSSDMGGGVYYAMG